MNGDGGGISTPQRLLFYLVVVVAGVVLGFFATSGKWWLGDRMNDIRVAFLKIADARQPPWFLSLPHSAVAVKSVAGAAPAPGVILVSGVDADRNIFVNAIDRDGTVLFGWSPDWFGIWPEMPPEIPADRRPDTRPGGLPDGMLLLDDGSLMLNFQELASVRLAPCGQVIWKRAGLNHHTIEPGPDGTFYIGGEDFLPKGSDAGYENYFTPLRDYTIDQIDADGHVLMRKKILEILAENDLTGLMHLSTTENLDVQMGGDPLRPDDIEMFPDGVPSAVFSPGDLLLSLRNINTILVVDPKTWKVRFRSTGHFLRQHDADFAPNDKILVFDNRNLSPMAAEADRYSRIVEIDAKSGAAREYFRGTGPTRFHTEVMGKQQLLANGDMLITSPLQGRAIEVDAGGNLVWEFSNVISDQNNGVLTEAKLLPLSMDRAFFEALRNLCGAE